MRSKVQGTETVDQKEIYNFAAQIPGVNVVARHSQPSHIALDSLRDKKLSTKRYKAPAGKCVQCYGCNKLFRKTHPVYCFSCFECGEKFQKYRMLTRDLSGKIAFVSGVRTKLGHQIALKLLRSGSVVYGTTRQADQATQMFSGYPDYQEWKSRLNIMSADFDTPNLEQVGTRIADIIQSSSGVLDLVVHSAAQTIRAREKRKSSDVQLTNRYGDPLYLDTKLQNSWETQIGSIEQSEIEEVLRVNTVAPMILTQCFIPLLRKSAQPYIIHVHAREGLFRVQKSSKHPHTNMAKAGLAMLTKCLIQSDLRTDSGVKFRIHGCDPGWISVDEYYEESRPWVVPPIDEVDGASRILFPFYSELESCSMTRRHYDRMAI